MPQPFLNLHNSVTIRRRPSHHRQCRVYPKEFYLKLKIYKFDENITRKTTNVNLSISIFLSLLLIKFQCSIGVINISSDGNTSPRKTL